MKRILTTLSQKWPEYLLEILVLIIGIYGAFTLENWNSENQNRAKEIIILKELNREFRDNRTQLNIIVVAHQKSFDATKKIISKFPIDPSNINLDSMAVYLWNVYSTYSFNPSQGTINSLISSSSFDLISNQKLRSLLVSWKDVYMDFSEDETRANEDIIINLAPYLNKHFPYHMNLRDPRFDLEILTTLEFENQVFQRYSMLEAIINNKEQELITLNHHIEMIIKLTE